MKKPLWLMGIALFLAFQASLGAAAQEQRVAEVGASRIGAHDPSTLTGALVAFFADQVQSGVGVPDPLGTPAARVAPTSFHFEAERMDLSINHRANNETLVVPLTPDQRWTSHDSFANTYVSSLEPGDFFDYFLAPRDGFPRPSIRFTTDGGNLSSSSGQTVQSEEYADGEATPMRQETVGSVSWESPNGWDTLTVTGSFALMVWDWDFEVTDSSGTRTVLTGKEWDATLDPPGDLVHGYGSEQDSQAYLYVTDGVLEVSFDDDASASLFLRDSTLATDGQTSFQAPHGVLYTPDGEEAVVSTTLTLRGNLRSRIEATMPGQLSALVTGNPESATLAGGKTIPLSTLPQPETQVPAWAWQGLLLLGVPAAGLLARRQAIGHRMSRLEAQMDAKDYAFVARQGPRLMGHARFHTDATVMTAVALLRLGRLAEAKTLLDGEPTWEGKASATQHYLYAHLYALRREWKEADRHADACLRIAPGMRREIEANPAFRAPREGPGQNLREGYA